MKRFPGLVAALGLLVQGGCDPVQSDAIAALGGEAPGVHRGPYHRPGQPCMLCHDGAFGDPGAFAVAGTVFARAQEPQAVNGATVSILDATGVPFATTTNSAGNFYVTPSSWTPAYPITRIVVTSQGQTATMYTEIGRSTSCATCHVDPIGPSSPGRIVLELSDGGTPL